MITIGAYRIETLYRYLLCRSLIEQMILLFVVMDDNCLSVAVRVDIGVVQESNTFIV